MAIGVVKWFNKEMGYGFLTPEGGGHDVFVHISVLARASLQDLEYNQAVEFETKLGPDGRNQTTSLSLR